MKTAYIAQLSLLIIHACYSSAAYAACEKSDGSCLFKEHIASAGIGKTTKWVGRSHDVLYGKKRSTRLSMTFTPTDRNSGTWTSTPLNPFSPTDQLVASPGSLFGSDYQELGDWSGKYTVTGNLIQAFEIVLPSGKTFEYGRASEINATGREIHLVETFAKPNAITVLRRSK